MARERTDIDLVCRRGVRKGKLGLFRKMHHWVLSAFIDGQLAVVSINSRGVFCGGERGGLRVWGGGGVFWWRFWRGGWRHAWRRGVGVALWDLSSVPRF